MCGGGGVADTRTVYRPPTICHLFSYFVLPSVTDRWIGGLPVWEVGLPWLYKWRLLGQRR